MKSKIFFSEALKLANSVKGNTSPNPAVGCVIEKNNCIVGMGATKKSGGDHAEIVALKDAGKKCKGASLYVTLEPCVDYPHKKTPSCSQAIINAGIKEVFIGMTDPNPKVNGNGIRQLKEAGIEVQLIDEYQKEIRELNEDFFKFIRTGLPFVYAKAAMTLDGNIASKDGNSKWISSKESRALVHGLRNKVDAVLVGVGTVLADNPHLNVRLAEKIKDPVRLIIDPDGRTPPDYHVMADDQKTIFIVKKGIRDEFKMICDKNKKLFLEFDTFTDKPSDHLISFKQIFKYLGEKMEMESILIEGGAKVLYHSFHENAVDKIMLFIAPKLLGGRGIPLFDGETSLNISEALQINDISVENIGEDILIQGYLNGGKYS
jgi:diaminohydroxyphosphoribosylaminopyrimidine deaminase / 5-amino-6-(5-phosphoribosylamino)uracil reductase